jgi:hypothetical protein
MRQRVQSCPIPWLRVCAAQLEVVGQCTQLSLLHGSTLVVARPTAVTCCAQMPITERPVRLLHQIKGEKFQTHSFIHSLQRSKQSCQRSNSSVVSPRSTAATRLQSTAVQPHICWEELATATQVTPICCQHLSTLHIIAKQSVLYTHKRSNITSSHTNQNSSSCILVDYYNKSKWKLAWSMNEEITPTLP